MKLIALDSSGLVASVAVMTETVMLAEYTVNYKKTHSQTLLPMLDEIVQMLELDLSEIGAVAIAAGPGSFTGLRIGSSTAKGLGLALNIPLIGVPTVDALAFQLYGAGGVICPLMDARRDQVYTGIYEYPASGFHVLLDQRAVALEEIVREVNCIGRPVIYLGDGVDAYHDQIIKMTQVPCSFSPSHLAKQRAGAVGALAFQYWEQGRFESAKDHVPVYLRQSQAEREAQ